MTPGKCPFCGSREVHKEDLIDEFPMGNGLVNRLLWITCGGCFEHYRSRTVLENA